MEYFAAVAKEEAKINGLKEDHQARRAEKQASCTAELNALQVASDRAIADYNLAAPSQVLAEKQAELKERKEVLAELEKKARGQARSIDHLKAQKAHLLSRVGPLEREAALLTTLG